MSCTERAAAVRACLVTHSTARYTGLLVLQQLSSRATSVVAVYCSARAALPRALQYSTAERTGGV